MNRYLIVNPFGIGDVLFTTPLIRAIKEREPDSFIGYWCNERVEVLLKNNPYLDKIFALSRGDLKKLYHKSIFCGIYKFMSLLSRIKKGKFQICLDFSLDHRYSLVAKLSDIKKRIGFNYKNRARFLTDKIDIDGYQSKHAADYYLDLLKFVQVKPQSKKLDLFVSEAQRIKMKNIFTARGISAEDLLVGIVPGAGESWGKDAALKHWPAIRFAQLADRITDELGAKIIILGSELEKPIADVIVSAMRNKPVDLVGKTDLEELSAAIESLHLLITNDGGPMHMAVALGVKTIAIFGPVDEKVYGPYPAAADYVVIKKDLICRPCYKNFRLPVCDRDKECIKSISIEEVFEAAKKLL